jgi:ferredoxin
MTPTKALRMTVNRERCQSHARFFALAPELFELDEWGNAHRLGDGTSAIGSGLWHLAQHAADRRRLAAQPSPA